MLADRVQKFFTSSDVDESVEVTRIEGDIVQDEAPAVHDGHDVREGLDRRDDDGNYGLDGKVYMYDKEDEHVAMIITMHKND